MAVLLQDAFHETRESRQFSMSRKRRRRTIQPFLTTAPAEQTVVRVRSEMPLTRQHEAIGFARERRADDHRGQPEHIGLTWILGLLARLLVRRQGIR
jgi:hypothetical protein